MDRSPMTARDEGFTIIEVMAAGALLSALGLCLVSGTTVLDRLSYETLLRQKAVFVLNGEMERVAALYTKTSFGSSQTVSTTGYTAVSGIINSGKRATYVSSQPQVTFAATTAASFTNASTANSTVWLYQTGNATQNYVWLDRDRSLLARLSWSSCDVTDQTSASCWVTGGKQKTGKNTASCYGYGGGTGVCDLITMFLDYPYTISGGAPTPLATVTATTMSLSTIVGRRE